MREKPILFSTPMVQAILDGRKTMTRRIVKPQPDDSGLWNHTQYPMSLESTIEGWWGTVEQTGESKEFKCKWNVGDLLWVKETTCQVMLDHTHDLLEGANDKSLIVYKANVHEDWMQYAKEKYSYKWKPSIFMPRSAARIFLEVTNIRIERLQDINVESCIAEGIEKINKKDGQFTWKNYTDLSNLDWFTVGESFRSLWNSINGESSWDENPWVWVIEFKRIEKI